MVHGPFDIPFAHHAIQAGAGRDTKLALPVAHQGFKLRIAFQLAGYGFHARLDLAARLGLVPAA